MRRDTLEDLLAETDAKLPPPPTAPLIDGVRARAAHRARAQLALAAVASLAIAATILYSIRPHPAVVRETRPTHLGSESGQWRAQLATLEATAALHQKKADDLIAAERGAYALRKVEIQAMLAPDPLSYLDQARDRAARIMLMAGDRLAGRPGGKAGAEETYRRAVQLFPDTPAAHEALERLKTTRA
jgi:hypothetical protein